MPRLIDIEAKDPNDSAPDPLMAMIYFFIVTSIYCVISIFIPDKTQKLIAKVCYILLVIIGEYFINLTLSQHMCGVVQWKTTMFITIIPWLMIFGVLHLFLIMFPGWMTPFSNTFGYIVAKLMGLPDLMKKILVEQNTDLPEASRALESVRSDNSLFINEFYAESRTQNKQKADADGVGKYKVVNGVNVPIVASESDQTSVPFFERPIFDKAWNKLIEGKIIKNPLDPKTAADGYTQQNSEKYKEDLFHFVQMKFTISEYVWNLLTGFLVTSISYNYIINTGCAKSPKEMKERYDKYEADQDKKHHDKKRKEDNQPTYTQT